MVALILILVLFVAPLAWVIWALEHAPELPWHE